ncbi:uncharacterized protein [Dysidea avara]|uniref:uncharacterized protein n=1 Tax=Dysidea avara TaxID=196820 RepID=UPI0033204C5E
MTVQIRLGGELLEGIDVNNGLRQGCTIAPTLFNLYSYAITKRWLSRIKNVESVGTRLLYRLDQQFFRRSTSGAEEFDINECRFADDVVLLATSCAGAQEAITEYHSVAAGLGLSVSFIKTKFMVAGHNGKLDTEVEKGIAAASRAFGALCRAVLQDRTLSVLTKRLVYQACVLNVLLTILGISRKKQWEQHITSEATRHMWDDPETISEKLIRHQLEWLGHLARMGDSRTPKRTLFG